MASPPDGDGVTALVWSPDPTADTLISRGNVVGCRESKMWKNQVERATVDMTDKEVDAKAKEPHQKLHDNPNMTTSGSAVTQLKCGKTSPARSKKDG